MKHYYKSVGSWLMPFIRVHSIHLLIRKQLSWIFSVRDIRDRDSFGSHRFVLASFVLSFGLIQRQRQDVKR
jgi:hypothetical protein